MTTAIKTATDHADHASRVASKATDHAADIDDPQAAYAAARAVKWAEHADAAADAAEGAEYVATNEATDEDHAAGMMRTAAEYTRHTKRYAGYAIASAAFALTI